jgi:hypothetical protein
VKFFIILQYAQNRTDPLILADLKDSLIHAGAIKRREADMQDIENIESFLGNVIYQKSGILSASLNRLKSLENPGDHPTKFVEQILCLDQIWNTCHYFESEKGHSTGAYTHLFKRF